MASKKRLPKVYEVVGEPPIEDQKAHTRKLRELAAKKRKEMMEKRAKKKAKRAKKKANSKRRKK